MKAKLLLSAAAIGLLRFRPRSPRPLRSPLSRAPWTEFDGGDGGAATAIANSLADSVNSANATGGAGAEFVGPPGNGGNGGAASASATTTTTDASGNNSSLSVANGGSGGIGFAGGNGGAATASAATTASGASGNSSSVSTATGGSGGSPVDAAGGAGGAANASATTMAPAAAGTVSATSTATGGAGGMESPGRWAIPGGKRRRCNGGSYGYRRQRPSQRVGQRHRRHRRFRWGQRAARPSCLMAGLGRLSSANPQAARSLFKDRRRAETPTRIWRKRSVGYAFKRRRRVDQRNVDLDAIGHGRKRGRRCVWRRRCQHLDRKQPIWRERLFADRQCSGRSRWRRRVRRRGSRRLCNRGRRRGKLNRPWLRHRDDICDRRRCG